MVSLTNLAALPNSTPPLAKYTTKPLSADQEQALLSIPEQHHARICELLGSYHEDNFWKVITDVNQAYAYIQWEATNQPNLVNPDPVVTAQLQAIEAERVQKLKETILPKPPQLKKVKSKELSPRAIANIKYIEACQNRKLKISELQEQRVKLRGMSRQIPSTLPASFITWAAEQRAACEAWIAKHAPADSVTNDAVLLRKELAEVESELLLTRNHVPQRTEFI